MPPGDWCRASALGEAAGAALEAPLLPLDLAAAVGQAPRAISSSPAGRDDFFDADGAASTTGFGKPGNIASKFSSTTRFAFRHGVGAGEDLPPVPAPGGEVAGDPLQLLDDHPGLHPGAQREGGEAPDRSDWDAAQPPAFPIWLNTSKIPSRRGLIVT